jgi:hypothetical protein
LVSLLVKSKFGAGRDFVVLDPATEPHPDDRVEFAPVVDARRIDMITAASNQGRVKFGSGAGPHLALGGFGDVFE